MLWDPLLVVFPPPVIADGEISIGPLLCAKLDDAAITIKSEREKKRIKLIFAILCANCRYSLRFFIVVHPFPKHHCLQTSAPGWSAQTNLFKLSICFCCSVIC